MAIERSKPVYSQTKDWYVIPSICKDCFIKKKAELREDGRYSGLFWRILLPLIGSFITTYLLGMLLVKFFGFMHWIVSSPDNGPQVIIVGFIVPYVFTVAVGILAFRKDIVRIMAVITGPILVTALIICGIFLLLRLSGSPPVD